MGNSASASNLLKEDRKRKKQSSRKQRKKLVLNKSKKNEMFLTKEELNDISAKELRRCCQKAGINTKAMLEKKSLVNSLYNYHRTCNDENSKLGASYGDDYGEIMEVIYETIPYFGGETKSLDKYIRENIQRLPSFALDTRDSFGNTLTMIVIQLKIYEFLSNLLSKDGDLNAKNKSGITCLHFACFTDSYSPDTVSMLIHRGAFPEVAEYEFGCTPLHWVASAGDTRLCCILCEAGALSTTIDKQGLSPIDYAKQSNHVDCVNLLESFAKKSKHIQKSNFLNITTGESLWKGEFQENYGTIEEGPKDDSHFVDHTDEHDINILADQNEHSRMYISPDKKQSLIDDTKENLGEIRINNIDQNDTSIYDRSPSSSSLAEFIPRMIKTLSKSLLPSEEHKVHQDSTCASLLTPQSNSVSKDELTRELTTMQSKIENFFVFQKMNSEPPSTKQELDTTMINDTRKAVSEISSKILNMHTELGEKNVEILSLKRKIEKVSISTSTNVGTNSDEIMKPEKEKDIERALDINAKKVTALEVENKTLQETLKRLESELISLPKNNTLEKSKVESNASKEIQEQVNAALQKIQYQSKKISELEKETKELNQALLDEKENAQKEVSRQKEIIMDLKTMYAEEIKFSQKKFDEMRVLKEEEEKEKLKAIEAKQEAIEKNKKLQQALQKEIDLRKKLHNSVEDLKGKIRVCVRVRPINSKENAKESSIILRKEDDTTCLMVQNEKEKVKIWEFDQIFSGTSEKGNSQVSVFKDTKNLVTSALDGFNVCIFAYGQTGSGKTYTMFNGCLDNSLDNFADDSKIINSDTGLAPRCADELFRVIKEREFTHESQVLVNMFEVYNDNLLDLLAIASNSKGNTGGSTPLRIILAEHSKSKLVEVEGSIMEHVQNAMELIQLFKKGAKVRTTSSTNMNAQSSRSHLITSIVCTLKSRQTGKVINGKLTLVDLAGSERVDKSGALGKQLKEAQSINKSLSALGDVINSLTSGSKHIPYRNHPLTMLMSDSLGGNAKTLMFVCCSPADYNRHESSNSLDFAKRCKSVTNKIASPAAVAVERDRSGGKIDIVRELKSELAKLKQEGGKSGSKRALVTPKRPGEK